MAERLKVRFKGIRDSAFEVGNVMIFGDLVVGGMIQGSRASARYLQQARNDVVAMMARHMAREDSSEGNEGGYRQQGS